MVMDVDRYAWIISGLKAQKQTVALVQNNISHRQNFKIYNLTKKMIMLYYMTCQQDYEGMLWYYKYIFALQSSSGRIERFAIVAAP